ncbi:hypothetical protein [Pedobacter sp. MC2016-14]|nr:hypothetical protein [Pedobacter sp. MC2016-14]
MSVVEKYQYRNFQRRTKPEAEGGKQTEPGIIKGQRTGSPD